jgi:ribosomal protein S18 acetylase RimI-like enzyme
MTWTIRTSQLPDVEAILSLWSEADAEPTHTDNAESLEQLIRHDRSAVIVAEDDHRLIGSVIAGWDGWRGSIYRLAVAPSHRRFGVARSLLHAAESRLSAVGAVRLQAIVVETERLATGFWHASDWEQQAHRLRFVKG